MNKLNLGALKEKGDFVEKENEETNQLRGV
jgi:hypothetical protein